LVVRGEKSNGTVVVWVHADGKRSLFGDGGQLSTAARLVLERGAAIVAIDPFGVGELKPDKLPKVNAAFAGYTFGYNRPLLAQRVHDILTAVAYARGYEKAKIVHLAGLGGAGPWVLLARGLCGDAVSRTGADAVHFQFEQVKKTSDEMMLPGALKYGGLEALAALGAPGELVVQNLPQQSSSWLQAVYRAAGAADKLQLQEGANPEKLLQDLLR
jgi:hypothetical protein